MLLPDQTYEQANNNRPGDFLRRSYDEFNRIIDLKEIDVKRLHRNIFDSDNADGLVVLTNNEMKFCQASRSGSSSVPSGLGVSGPGSSRCSGKSPGGKEDTDSAIWSTREQLKGKNDNGEIVSSNVVTSLDGSGTGKSRVGGRKSIGRRHQRSTRRRRPNDSSSLSSLSSDIQTDVGSEDDNGGPLEDSALDDVRRGRDELENDYDRTSDFFNNIPEFQGESLGPFSLNKRNDLNIRTNIDILRACELFLMRNRIRPDFFCKYKTVVNASVSAPPSFPLSGPRTPVESTIRKPKSVSPPMQRPPSAHANLGTSATKSSAAINALYSVPNRAGKRRRFIATSNTDASSSNEAVHLQQRLKSLSSELVTLRNRLHTGAGQTTPATAGGPNGAVSVGNAVITSATTPNTNNPQTLGGHGTTTTANTTAGTGAGLQSTTVGANGINILSHLNSTSNGNGASCNNNTTNGKNPMLVTPSQCIPPNSSTLNHQANILPIVSPRNTSIPYPLPHHNSTGAILIGDTAQCGGGIGTNAGITGGGTLPRRTTVGYTSKHQTALGGPGTGLGGGAHLISPGGASSGPGGGTIIGGTLKQHFTHGGGRPSGVNEVGGGTGGNGTGTKTVKLDDLIHLPGPLTEDAVMRTLQTRFNEGKFFTNVGPILLSVNPYHDVGNPLTLSSTRSVPLAPQLRKIVQEAVRQQAETGYPQAIILSGTSGSGKTHCSMLLLRQLFAVAGGGPETDAFKHLAAAFTVLRSLGSAKTSTNSESSRIGQFIEVQVTDGALYRTKIHCYFLDQTRVIRPLPNEKNYHIFYQMLAGLNAEECARLNLEGYSPANLRYLQNGDIRQDEHEDAARFQAWKACLGILGIPFLDVVRVLAAVLLLGNVQFVDGQGLEVEVSGETELNAVANLLGVPPAQLFRGLTIRTHNARGQLIKSVCDANMSNMTRDSLAKALYCRTVATIVRRANSLKRLGSTLGTLSSDSNESVHNQAEVASQHASTIGGNAGSKSMAALNNAVRHATDGFIGILDMFGFEEPRPAQLEHLCINLCAETMQHFYNTHIFKSSVESCREEGIICDTEVDYVDNVPCIDLISSLRTGLLSMLDAECSVRGTAETYVAKIKVQHRNSARLEQRASEPYDPRMFAIRHFAGRVEYDTTNFLDTNRDVVPDDLVSVFYKHTCNFGFATHLFGTELKALYAQENVPRGLSFRIAPTSHTDLLNGDEPVSTLTQDFHTRLDNLLRTLVHARPHFVRCIRSNTAEKAGIFDRGTVVRQIRALQVLETVNLMASGFPHRMRFKQFTARYRMLAPFRLLRRCEEKALEDCKLILDFALENPPELDGSVTLSWAPGKRHVFLSEGIRQHLENLRTEVRMKSATLIQATWRGWNLRKRLGTIRRSHEVKLVGNGLLTLNKSTAARPSNTGPTTKTNNTGTATRPRPQPIAGTPPPDPNEKCDSKIIAQTCTLFGLDLERPPPVPPSRSYTVTGNSKLGYPQTRIMKMNFPEDSVAQSVGEQLRKGEAVTVTGASHRRGHLIVEHNGISLHVPFQYMELVKTTTSPPPPTGASVNI